MRAGVFVIGLTGSIGMGKSTVASMFGDLGCCVIDSDAVVHELLGFGGAAVERVLALCPEVRIQNADGEVAVDRVRLGSLVSSDGGDLLTRLEGILHPLLAERRAFVLDGLQASYDVDGDLRVAVIDAALLLERGLQGECDYVVVVSAPFAVQAERVLARENMDEGKFRYMLSRQMSDEEKCGLADLVLDSSVDLAEMRLRVGGLLDEIKAGKIEKRKK